MEFWYPEPIWEGEDVYIVGGGPSLKDFEYWDVLHDKKVIGCNTAYRLGNEICDFVLFLDKSFWDNNQEDLKNYKGPIVSNLSYFEIYEPPKWVKVMKRIPRGLGTDDTLASNFSSGASATNLAISLGALNVYLLGMDMKSIDGNANWHDESNKKMTARKYERFMEGFRLLQESMKKKRPHVEIINVNDDSAMTIFPVEGVDEHFKEDFSLETDEAEDEEFIDFGSNVSSEFENVEEAGVDVYRNGRWYTVYAKQDVSKTPLHEKSLTREEVQEFVDSQKESYVDNVENEDVAFLHENARDSEF